MKAVCIKDIELKLFIEAVAIRYSFDLQDYDKNRLRYYLYSLLLSTGSYCFNDIISLLLNDEKFFGVFVSEILIK